MRLNKIKSTTEKIANVMIVLLVVVGTIFFVVVNQVSEGAELMSKLFLVFLGAIITVQVIPGLVLLGAMLKGLIQFGRKQEEAPERLSDRNTHK